mgnify:CR=1 FL=1
MPGARTADLALRTSDALGRLYQVEIQILVHADLPARMLYAWADLYSQQLHRGQDYRELRPTYALWPLGDDLLRDDPAYAHRYRLRDLSGSHPRMVSKSTPITASTGGDIYSATPLAP